MSKPIIQVKGLEKTVNRGPKKTPDPVATPEWELTNPPPRPYDQRVAAPFFRRLATVVSYATQHPFSVANSLVLRCRTAAIGGGEDFCDDRFRR